MCEADRFPTLTHTRRSDSTSCEHNPSWVCHDQVLVTLCHWRAQLSWVGFLKGRTGEPTFGIWKADFLHDSFNITKIDRSKTCFGFSFLWQWSNEVKSTEVDTETSYGEPTLNGNEGKARRVVGRTMEDLCTSNYWLPGCMFLTQVDCYLLPKQKHKLPTRVNKTGPA